MEMNSESSIYHGSADLPALKAIIRNLRELPRALSWSAALSGLLIVLISCTGPVAMVVQAANAGNLTNAQTATWLWSCWIGSGLFGLYLSLRLRMPIIGAWSTPSIALLLTGLAEHSLRDAVGAYFIAAVVIILIGVTGIFKRILMLAPPPVIMAMLAGVLFEFGVGVFKVLPDQPGIIIAMVAGYFVARRFGWRAPVLASLFAGLVVAFALREVHSPHLHVALAKPEWVNPTFSVSALITLAIPLILLTLTSQYAPGMAVMTTYGYEAPINRSLVTGGVLSLASAGFVGSGVNSAAITAAIGAGDHAEPDKTRRYTAGVVCGIAYVAVGLLGSTLLGLFGALPAPLLAALAGLGILPAIGNSAHEAMANPEYREAALITLLVTVSGIHPLQLGSPFWGLLAGIATHQMVSFGRRRGGAKA